MQAWAVSLVLAFVACALVGGVIAPEKANAGFTDAASVLAVISLAAVSIERAIEGMLTALSGRLGEWWPLRVVRDEFVAFESATNDVLGPIAQDTIAALQVARDALDKGDARIVQLDSMIAQVVSEKARLDAQLTDVRTKLAPGSASLSRLGEINTSMTSTLVQAQALASDAASDAQTALRGAKETAEKASLLISSFTDNPARRVAALVIGTSVGMVIAGALGVNLFQATIVPPEGASTLAGVLAGKLGILLTGIVIGLGSSPTHEIVKSLQAYKDARAGADEVTTVLPPGPAVVAGAIQEGAAPGFAIVVAEPVVLRTRRVRRSG